MTDLDTPADRGPLDARFRLVGGVLLATHPDHDRSDTRTATVGGGWPDPVPWAHLRAFAEVFADVQANRISIKNRIRSAEIPDDVLDPVMDAASTMEKAAKKALLGAYLATVPEPIRRWQAETRGVGEHLLARLLGVIGHPCVAYPHEWVMDTDPRLETAVHSCGNRCGSGRHLVALDPFRRRVSDLWSYCGVGDPERKRRKGMSQDDALRLGSPQAKMLIHLVAAGVLKSNPKIASTAKSSTPSESVSLSGDPHPDRFANPEIRPGGGTSDQQANPVAVPKSDPLAVHPADQSCLETHIAVVGGGTSDQQASEASAPKPGPLAVHPADQIRLETHIAVVGGGTSDQQAIEVAVPKSDPLAVHPADQSCPGTHPARVGGDVRETHQTRQRPPSDGVPSGGSPYRSVYDQARHKYDTDERYAGWSDGHRHNSALRLIKKAILKDLWRAAALDLADEA